MRVGPECELLLMQSVLQVDEQDLGTMLTTVRDLRGGRDFGWGWDLQMNKQDLGTKPNTVRVRDGQGLGCGKAWVGGARV